MSALIVVQSLYSAFGAADVPKVLELLDPDVDWKYHGPRAIPFSGARRGRAQMAEFFRLVGESTEIHAFEPREMIERDDTVIVYGWERCTARKTGKTWECDWVHIFTVRAGKVTRLREFYDTYAKTLAFLGKSP